MPKFLFFYTKKEQRKRAKINVLFLFVTRAEHFLTEHCSGGSRIFQTQRGRGATAQVGATTYSFGKKCVKMKEIGWGSVPNAPLGSANVSWI